MRTGLVSLLSATLLYGANEPQAILNDVAKLRQKYEECRQEQSALSGVDATAKIKGYQKRISNLENEIKQRESELLSLKKRNTETERELSQKKGVIESLEKTLTSKDQKYREFAVQNERLTKETNTIKVSKIERENLKRALVKAKTDLELLEKSMGKTDKETATLRTSLADAKAEIEKLRARPTQVTTAVKGVEPTAAVSDQSAKVKALQTELEKANGLIVQLQKAPPQISVQEKIVTKVVEPTEKIVALQRELSAAQATIANLKNSSEVKTVAKEKVIEKVVYKDRPVVQEKIVEKVVYKDRPVVQEKIVEKVVYKERPIPSEKVAVKSIDATEKLNQALLQKLTPPTKTALQKELKAPATVASAPVKQGKSSAYRMAANAPIYNAPGGAVVDTWEERRSFTAGNPSGGWVHITGYFVNRVWQRTVDGENLYVRESDVIRR
jgi:predicted  nucleic acid-binding Zn-ribbon protein